MMFKILYILLLTTISFAASVTSTTLPKPFFFTENKGQWDDKVLFKCSARNGMTWFLERDGITLLASTEDRTKPPILDPMDKNLPEMMRKHPARYPMKSHALKFKFLASNTSDSVSCLPEERSEGSFAAGKQPQRSDVGIYSGNLYSSPKSIDPQNELSWHNNYFLGNDSSKWAPDCRNYSSIIYRDVWDGIDIEWYENAGKLEFDFIVQPGADPSQIRMSCEGLSSCLPEERSQQPSAGEETWGSTLVIGKYRTELLLPTSLGNLQMIIPACYQLSANNIRSNEVAAEFAISNGNIFSITLPNGYDKSQILRIDPLVWSTYLGGTQTDVAYGIVNDGSGGTIITGKTASTTFPTSTSAFDTTYNGGDNVGDCFITHLGSTGSQILYSTFIGGSNWDIGMSIANSENNAVNVTGYTLSSNFPSTNGSSFAGSIDCFVTRLNSSGSQLSYSTFLGGSGDDKGLSVVNDDVGGCYVTGYTSSTNFPTTIGSFNRTNSGGNDCFLTHFNSTGTQLIYSTYLGGNGSDMAYGIARDRVGGVFLTGTAGLGFPTTIGAYDTAYNGGTGLDAGDCFITHLNTDGSQLIYSTFLGGAGEDVGRSIYATVEGRVIVTGGTASMNFPTTLASFDSLFSGGTYDCFITQLNSSGSQLIYSTFFGGTSSDAGLGICEDENGNAFVTGYTTSNNLPTTIDALQSSFQGSVDCFVAQLNFGGTRLLYSTYLGGTMNDQGCGIVSDNNGGVIICGSGGTGYPVTPNAFDTSYAGGGDVIVTRIRFDSTSVRSEESEVVANFSLSQNYPNPFNSSTTISYSIPSASVVSLKMYDLTGREISTLVDQRQQAGSYRVQFDGKCLSSGTYFVQLQADEKFTKVQKVVLLK